MARSSDYRVPMKEASESFRLGWMNEALQQGRSFQMAQRPMVDVDKARDEIAGLNRLKVSKKLSQIWINRPKREVAEVIATLSNLRPSWNYATDNNKWHEHASKLNKLKDAWWANTFADLSFADTFAYSAVDGTGYAMPYWKKNFHSLGRGDIAIESFGVDNVLFVQMPRNNDFQDAYATIIAEEIPIHLAHTMYPLYQDRIHADRDSPGWLAKSARTVKKFSSMFLNFSGPRGGDDNFLYPTCDRYTIYIRDTRINDTGHKIPMGEPGTSWFYEVPSLGDDLPTGFKDGMGHTLTRKATAEDCRFYPLRRLMVAFNNCIVYDDTSTDWHGMVPLIRFRLDEWPWEANGYSLLRDASQINAHANNLRRGIEDSHNARLSPALRGTNSETTAKADLEKFDPRIPNQILQLDTGMTGEEPLKPILPYQHYEVPAAIFQYLKDLEAEEGYIIGVQDFTNLAKARQIPSGDAQEKLLQMIGPLMESRTRKIEKNIGQFGQMWKYLAFQWYNSSRREQILGSAGTVNEDVDWEPGQMTPSHVGGEDEEKPSIYSVIDRRRWHANNFHIRVTPYSITGMSSMQRKLTYLQLAKMPGMPIDPWTIGEKLDIDMGPLLADPDTGKIPTTPVERYIVWQKLLAGIEVEKVAETLNRARELGIDPSLLGGGAHGKGQRGRPPSNNAPPQVKSKDSGQRSTITTSK